MNDSIDNTIKVPDNFRYNEDHIWMYHSDTDSIICGITEFLAKMAGEIITIEYIRNIVNMEVNSGDSILSIDSLNSSFLIKTPMSGTIIKINDNCLETPYLINNSPYNQGWLFIISTNDLYIYEQQLYSDEYEYLIVKEMEE